MKLKSKRIEDRSTYLALAQWGSARNKI